MTSFMKTIAKEVEFYQDNFLENRIKIIKLLPEELRRNCMASSSAHRCFRDNDLDEILTSNSYQVQNGVPRIQQK